MSKQSIFLPSEVTMKTRADKIKVKSRSNVKVKKRTRSIKLTIFLMRLLGLWHSTNKMEKLLSNVMLSITVTSIVHSIAVQLQDLYYSRNNLTMLIFVAPLVCVVVTELAKVVVFTVKRERVMRLNKFLDAHFWRRQHSPDDIEIFNNCDKLCTHAIIIFIMVALSTCWYYLLFPFLEKNTRAFPFPLRFELAILYETPYYEIIYVAQIFGALTMTLCLITFSSYLFVVNLFTAAHFNILNVHLTTLCDFDHVKEQQTIDQLIVMTKLKEYIIDHQMLIHLTEQIEDLYCFVMLLQVFGSATEFCFCLMQILFARATLNRNVLSVNFLLSYTFQLYFYCYSSHEIFESSANISQAIYSMKWFNIVDPRVHRDFTRSIQIVACRARRPCILSVGKFYPLTLQAFTSVLKTSLSYFTVLRQIAE